MNEKLISVIVPVYQVEKYLRKSIDSLLNQTYQNLEIILVDDGSPDNCPEMCDKWAQYDPRIRVIHQENGGASSARNAGLDIATGEYIGFVDSDDYIDEKMYEILLTSLIKSKKKMFSARFFQQREKFFFILKTSVILFVFTNRIIRQTSTKCKRLKLKTRNSG